MKLEDKKQFFLNMGDYVNRDFLILEHTPYEDFKQFCSKHTVLVAKKADSGQGRGVKVITELYHTRQLYDQLKADQFDLVEESVTPHPLLKAISPIGLSPIRLFTYIDEDGKPHIIFTAIIFAQKDPVVNFTTGGIKAIIDPITGEIVTHAIKKNNEQVKAHPVTKQPIKGVMMPDWEELREMMLKAAMEFPKVRFIGWDCALSDKGPLILEANARRPGINGQQMPGYDKADEEYAEFEFLRQEFKKTKHKERKS